MFSRPWNLAAWLNDAMIRYRVILRPGEGERETAVPPDVIISRVPEIRVDCPAEAFHGRRRRIRFQADGITVSFKARTRPMTADGAEPGTRVYYALERLGGKVPVYEVDGPARTIRLLVDVATAAPIEPSAGMDPETFLARVLVGTPVEALLREDGEPIVGSQVSSRITRMISGPTREEEQTLRQEMSQLEGMLPHFGGLVDYVQARIQAISRWLANTAGAGPGARSGGEDPERVLAMLRKVVEGRACAQLRVGDGELGGIVNPAPGPGSRGRAPMEFLVRLAPGTFRASVFLWRFPGGQRRRPYEVCLGSGERLLLEYLQTRALYDIVDLVLNYIETNRVGLIDRAQRPGLPRREASGLQAGEGMPHGA